MPVCAKAIQQPDGTLVLALDPATTNLSTCPYVVEDGASSAWRELGNLTLDDAQSITLAIALLWAMAWGFKQIARVLASPRSTESDS